MPPEWFRPYFDVFSWQSFIVLAWPADPAKRGVPLDPGDPGVLLRAGTRYPSVWTTYYTGGEMYDSGQGASSPCPSAGPGTRVLLMATKASTLLEDVNQAFSYPLVDQAGNYVYYEIDFNTEQYDFVRSSTTSCGAISFISPRP